MVEYSAQGMSTQPFSFTHADNLTRPGAESATRIPSLSGPESKERRLENALKLFFAKSSKTNFLCSPSIKINFKT